MSIVYRKTERGQTEIATRQYRLAPRLRSALVVVDGKRSQLELASMIASEPQQTLQALLEAGFIEPADMGGVLRALPPTVTDSLTVELPPEPSKASQAPEEVEVPHPVPHPVQYSAQHPQGVAHEEAITGYAVTRPLEEIPPASLPVIAPVVASVRPTLVQPPLASRPPSLAQEARSLEITKRHAVQWLSQQLGPYAEGANRRIERSDTPEALGSAILVARSVVEQQLGAQAANTFEAEMFAALRRAAAG